MYLWIIRIDIHLDLKVIIHADIYIYPLMGKISFFNSIFICNYKFQYKSLHLVPAIVFVY